MYPSALGVIPDPLALTPVLFFQVTPILDDINLFKFLIKKKKKWIYINRQCGTQCTGLISSRLRTDDFELKII